jgi:hypothetical protein
MKKTITILCAIFAVVTANAQSTLSDFENLTLPANSFYTSTASISWTTTNGVFRHQEGGGFWTGGFAYTNKYDSTTATFANLYGVKPKMGYNGSNIYVVGQDGGIIKTNGGSRQVDGFYVTNTTYAFKTIRNGNQFSRKFGDTTGAHTGTTVPQGSYPDYFKLIAKGYLNGVLKTDSVTFMLADYTFTNNANDYVVSTWQYMNTAIIGVVDSIKFVQRSSDNSGGFMNTPAFFGLDNFSTGAVVSINEHSKNIHASLYPVPFKDVLTISIDDPTNNYSLRILNILGKNVFESAISERNSSFDLNFLETGIYFAEISTPSGTSVRKIVKE